MHIQVAAVVLVVSTAFLGAGCATVESMGHEPSDEGVSFSVPASCSFVRDALQPALLDLKFTIGTVDDSGACDRDVVAAMGISAFSWGELVRVTLREGDANDTVLSVTTKRRLATNIIAKGDWSKEIHAAVINQLNAMGKLSDQTK